MPAYSIVQFGAVGDGETANTKAIQAAIDACHQAGGGSVVVPAGGVYVSGTLQLRSFVDLHLENGAVLLAAGDQESYRGQFGALVESCDTEYVSITGRGVIDAQGKRFMEKDLGYVYQPRKGHFRPRLMGLVRSHHLTIRDVTLRDSASWTLHLVGCDDVLISGVRILNDLKLPNCDGIDPDHCRNVRISDCHIEAGDDCIVLKNTRGHAECGPTENITVTGCTLVSTSAAIKIGTEGVNDFRNLVFDSCVIQRSSRGLAIQVRDQGNVENVVFSNMVVETRLFEDHWWGKAEPIYVTAIHRFAAESDFQPPEWNPTGALGRVRHVRFSNILCRSENGVFVAGSSDAPVEDVTFDNVRVEVDKWTKWPGGIHDRRPCDALGPAFRDPSLDPGLTRHDTSGFYLEQARDITLHNCQVLWGESRQPYWGKAIEQNGVQGIEIEGFRGADA